MENKTLGFIGAGRVTRIILLAFRNRNVSFKQIVVTDTNQDVLKKLDHDFPGTITSSEDLKEVVNNDIVFIALHPPVVMETLLEIGKYLRRNTILVSLAPKITIEKISKILGSHKRIARLIPNAPTAINQGYNPVSISDGLSDGDEKMLTEIFKKLGKSIVVAEEKLEAFAIITAMSPTYFWFQFQELFDIGLQLGLSHDECLEGISDTIKASLDVLFTSGLSKKEVFDLIPVKPIADHETDIIKIYQSKLIPLFDKIKP